jgi:hypothetical protein
MMEGQGMVGQIKANHEAYGQPLVNTWIEFIFLIIA